VPRHVLGAGFTPPSDLLNIASVGIGGMGATTCAPSAARTSSRSATWTGTTPASRSTGSPQDLEQRKNRGGPAEGGRGGPERGDARSPIRCARASRSRSWNGLVEQLPKAKRYSDYREMLSQQKDIDALIIATPDHMHAPIALAAMDLGKARLRAEAALLVGRRSAGPREEGEGQSEDRDPDGQPGSLGFESRTTVEYIQQGAIGDIKEVHVWTNRPLGYWPQGLPRPNAGRPDGHNGGEWTAPGLERPRRRTPSRGGDGGATIRCRQAELDLFLGVAPQVDYPHLIYHPFNWRGWVDWGQGALGDMGAHLIDFPLLGARARHADSVETISTPFNDVCYPTRRRPIRVRGARQQAAVKLTWYDGGMMPPRPAGVQRRDGRRPAPRRMVYKEQFAGEGGVMYIGSKGKLMHETYGYKPAPACRSRCTTRTASRRKTLPRIKTTHEMNWVEAAKGRPSVEPFEYAARLSKSCCSGVVSLAPAARSTTTAATCGSPTSRGQRPAAARLPHGFKLTL
jgi:hypothetical protein